MDYFRKERPVHFVFPIDGDCLNSYDGEVKDGVLYVGVTVSAPCGGSVTVNGIPCVEGNDGEYKASVPISDKTVLTATDGVNSDSVTVFDYRHTEKKFRISSDDNIFFLYDINEHRDVYKSVFENPYLAVYKEAHDRYGACCHLNLFYETDAQPNFLTPMCDYFNLSMMTDKFKSEFEANSDWLRFSFHARGEFPDAPYKYTPALRVEEDELRVEKEIIRFAGEKTLAHTTTVHFGEATREGTRVLRKNRYTALTGYFEMYKGKPHVAYYYPEELINHVGARDFWVNTEDDILHGRIDLVLNTFTYDRLEEKLNKVWDCPHRRGFLSFMIHEQYFYPQYSIHRPQFKETVLDACRFAYEHGYTGTLIEEVNRR